MNKIIIEPDCFEGDAAVFCAWRKAVAHVLGYDLEEIWITRGRLFNNDYDEVAIFGLLNHSDSEGTIENDKLVPIVDVLIRIREEVDNYLAEKRKIYFSLIGITTRMIEGFTQAVIRGSAVTFRS